MKKILQISCVALFMTTLIKLHAQATLPYFTGFDNAVQKNGWTIFVKGGAGSGWQYTTNTSKIYTAPSALWQIYSTIGNVDDWFVSPYFNIPGGGKIDSVRYMNNGLMTLTTLDTVAIYLLQGSQDPAMATKILLFDIRGTDFVNDGVYRKKMNLALASFTGKSYIAFRFKCQQFNWLEPYFDNLAIRASASAPVASFSLSTGNICKGNLLTLKDQSTNNPASWNWQIPGGMPSSSTASLLTTSFATAGIYTITLVSSNAVGPSASVSKTIQVSACTAIGEEWAESPEVMIYPNPSSQGSPVNLQIARELKDSEIHFKVFNVLGELVCNKKIDSTSLNRIYMQLPAGSYVYTLHNKDLLLKKGKLIVE